eukprot:980762-Pleurochrysis_carterae.AAC.3
MEAGTRRHGRHSPARSEQLLCIQVHAARGNAHNGCDDHRILGRSYWAFSASGSLQLIQSVKLAINSA